MKASHSALLVTAILLLVGLLMAIFMRPANDENTSSQDIAVSNGVVEKIPIVSENESDDIRRQQMQDVFSELKNRRQTLKSRANLLKSKIWQLTMPPDQAALVSEKLHQAYAYLKNPAMLGAYHQSAQMQREIKQVDAMLDGRKGIFCRENVRVENGHNCEKMIICLCHFCIKCFFFI